LLRFTFSKRRPTGMPVLGMLYPCRVLANRFDPLKLTLDSESGLPTQKEVIDSVQEDLRQLLAPIIKTPRANHQPVCREVTQGQWEERVQARTKK